MKDECITSICLEKLTIKSCPRKYETVQADYYSINFLVNDIKTGQRIGKTCLQIVDNASIYNKYEISLNGLFYRDEKDVLVLSYF